MRAVQNKRFPLRNDNVIRRLCDIVRRQHLEARVPYGTFQPLFHRLRRDAHTLLAQHIRRFDRKRGVDELMCAEQFCRILFPAVQKPLSRKRAGKGFRLAANAAKRIKHFRRPFFLRAGDRRALDYRSLFACNFTERIAEQRAMVTAYFRNHGQDFLFHRVRGVPSASEPRFEHDGVAPLFPERKQGERGFLFEGGGTERFHRGGTAVFRRRRGGPRSALPFRNVADDGHIFRHFVVRKRLARNAETLVVAEHGRRVVRPDAVARGGEHGGEHCADRALAVGARDVNDGIRHIGRAERVEQFPLPFQAVIRAVRLYRTDVTESFGIKQKAPPQKHFFSQVKRE